MPFPLAGADIVVEEEEEEEEEGGGWGIKPLGLQ